MQTRPSFKYLLIILQFAMVFQTAWSAEMENSFPGPKEVMIPMPDGINLAADLYFPESWHSGDRLPVILEYTPGLKTN